MKIFKDRKNLQREILNTKGISFVPTMGALHKGHISLIERIIRQNKIKLNKKRTKSSQRLQTGDLIEVFDISKFKANNNDKKIKKNITTGIAFVYSTFNNTIISITDENGNVVSWSSAGAKRI